MSRAVLVVALLVAPGPASEPHSCAAATELCEGEIAVPLDWSDPAGTRITVAFAWVPHSDRTRAAAGTIVANPGGPGAALPMVPRLRQTLGPLLERRNLLVVEPRGHGRSHPLLCDGLDLDDEATTVACARKLGARISYFTTDQAVADMNAVREALGVPSVSFYGNSHGTVFAQAYATRFPEHTDAVFLDAVVLIGDDGYANVDARRTDTDIFELICSRSPACAVLPESPGALFERVVHRLRAEPDTALSPRAFAIVVNGVNVNAVAGRGLLGAARAYLVGDPLPLRHMASEFRFGTSSATGAEYAGYLAYMCGDARFAWERSATPRERRRQQDHYLATARPLHPFTLAEMGGRTDIAYWCTDWPTPRPSPPVPVDAVYPQMPVLAMAGDFDSHTPDEVAKTIARFPNSKVARVRYGGHAMAMSSAPVGGCVREIMRAFLTAPHDSVPPGDVVCDAETYRALGNYPRTLGEVPAARADGLREPERRLLATAFATVADVVTRFDPNHRFPVRRLLKGLRGGETRFDVKSRTITLEEVRFVEDVAVSGAVRLDARNVIMAELRVTGDGQPARDLWLEWTAFLPRDDTHVTGRLDDAEFTAWIPLLD